MAKSTIWICYDLGVRGDYESLYAWLDDQNAKECGDSLAVLTYSYTSDLIDELKKDIKNNVKFGSNSRIYVIYRNKSENKNKGTFIVGGRRASPWLGYGQSSTDLTDEEI